MKDMKIKKENEFTKFKSDVDLSKFVFKYNKVNNTKRKLIRYGLLLVGIVGISVGAILFSSPTEVSQKEPFEKYTEITKSELVDNLNIEGQLKKIIVDGKELDDESKIDSSSEGIVFVVKNKIKSSELSLDLISNDTIKPKFKVMYDKEEVNSKSEFYKEDFDKSKITIESTDSRYGKDVNFSELKDVESKFELEEKDDSATIKYTINDGSNELNGNITISLKEKPVEEKSKPSSGSGGSTSTGSSSGASNSSSKPSSSGSSNQSSGNKKPVSIHDVSDDIMNTPGEQIVLDDGRVINVDDFDSIDDIFDFLVPVTGRSPGHQGDLKGQIYEAIHILRREAGAHPIPVNEGISSAIDKVIANSYNTPHIDITPHFGKPSSQITMYFNLYADTNVTYEVIDLILYSQAHLEEAIADHATEFGASAYLFNDRELVIMINIGYL